MVERSNSFNSNIDWIVHGIDGSRPHTGILFRFVVRSFASFSATLIAWTERLRSFVRFEFVCMYAYRIVVNGLHINRFVFGLITREASINISTDNRHIHYRSAFNTHTHTHTQTHRHNTLQIWSFSNMPLFRGLMKNR